MKINHQYVNKDKMKHESQMHINNGHKNVSDHLRISMSSSCKLFEYSPIATLEADYSHVKGYLEDLKKKGVQDLRKYFDKYPEKVLSLADKIKILRANKAAMELYEAESQSDLLNNVKFIFNKESFDVFKEEMINLSAGSTEFCSEALSQTLAKKEQSVLLRVIVPPESKDDLSHLFVYICDISGLKQMEEDLKESEEKYRTIVEAASDAILVVDIESGIILDANKSSERLLGISADNIVGMHFSQIHPEDKAQDYTNIFKRHMKQTTMVSENFIVCNKRGEHIPVSISSSIIKLRGKKCISAIFRELHNHESKNNISTILKNYAGKKFISPGAVFALSHRQREILSLIAYGNTNKQIAEQLFISEKTVETHRTRIMQKLDIHKIADLVRFAIVSGLLEDNQAAL